MTENWKNVEPSTYETGVLIEKNSQDCRYIPPTPVSSKWIATYSDIHTESAQCDSSSEIVMDEINRTNLVSVEIGNCVTSIGKRAFYYCSGLTSIDIPNGVTSIGERAFYRCSGLTSISIPSGVTSISDEAFQGCRRIESITINATTPSTLGSDVFYNTNNCPIYVPSGSVDAYKAASGWSYYSSRIQAIT